MIKRAAFVFQKLAALALILFYLFIMATVLGTDWEHQIAAAILCLMGIGFSVFGINRPIEGFKDSVHEIWLTGAALLAFAVCGGLFLSFALESPRPRLVAEFTLISPIPLLHFIVALPDLLTRRFSLRSLMIGVLAFGVAGTVIAELFNSRLRIYNQEKPAIECIEKANGTVYQEDWKVRGVNLRASAVGDEDMEVVSKLDGVRSLDVSNTKLTDACVPLILKMNALEHLNLNGSSISGDSIDRIKQAMPKLKIYR